MPRKPSQASKTSVYRLTLEGSGASPIGDGLAVCIQRKYLDADFQATPVCVGTVLCLLTVGTITTESPKWKPHVESLTGTSPNVRNMTPAAALLVPLGSYIYALTWGFGHLILDPGVIDPGFGLRFAIRKASADQVRSLTSHTMDTLARTARTSVPAGASLDAFGLEEVGEVISRLVGRISITGLTASQGKKEPFATVRGAEGLSIPLGKTPEALLNDLRYLDFVVANEPPAQGLEHFEHTRPLLPGSPVMRSLEKVLSRGLHSGNPMLALSWPAEWQEDQGEADSYQLRGAGSSFDEQPDQLELTHLLTPLQSRPEQDRLEALKKITIQGLDGDGNAITRAVRGDRWITYQTDHEDQRYVFHQGRWFNIGGAYLDMLRGKVDRILGVMSAIQLTDWPCEVKPKGNIGPAVEGDFNRLAYKRDRSLLCLDKKLVRTTQHPRGFEACDLLGPDNEFIHVKRLDDSVSASHLFNQAIVSAEALRRQPDALGKLRKIIEVESGGTRTLSEDFRVKKVILAFGGRKATSDELFTFSQVTLVRCAQRLAELEVELEVLEVSDTDAILQSSDLE